ncbi:hypothetical protein [Nocardioides sp. NPDC006273]|uniref:hypothetical protein n=1 Tax=Nocardioides sp. NPDC006273 TaxID=3155598 RepID=UPI0033A01828
MVWSRAVRLTVEALAWFAVAIGLIWLLLALSAGGDVASGDLRRPFPAELRDLAPILAATCLSGGVLTLVLLRNPPAARISAGLTGVMVVAAGFGFRLVPETDQQAAPYYQWVPIAAGALLILLALIGWRPDRERPDSERGVEAALLVMLLWVIACAVGIWAWVLSGDWLGAYEDQESTWDDGGPEAVLVFVALVAVSRQVLRR